MVKKNACVFISGQGSNLKNLIHKSRDYNFPINIKLVICDKKNAFGINHAKINSIPYTIINTKLRNYESQILLVLKKYKISIIFLAGYMKIISNNFLTKFGMFTTPLKKKNYSSSIGHSLLIYQNKKLV